MRNQKLPYYVWNPWNLDPQPLPYEDDDDDEDFIEEDTTDDQEE